MRSDMAKVIVERPRILDGCSRKGRRLDFEDMPSRIGMRRQHREKGGYKQLNENLAPLRRFIAKQVGRPWDKVYSEICENLRADNTVQQHVRDHLKDFVAVDPRRRSYSVYRGGVREFRDMMWWEPFYVGADGILKRTERHPDAKRERREKAARREAGRDPVVKVVLGGMSELRAFDGVWFMVEFAPMPAPQYVTRIERRIVPLKRWDRESRTFEMEVPVRYLVSERVYDVVLRSHVAVGPAVDGPEERRAWERSNREGRYAVSKRQITTRELRRYGLANGVVGDSGSAAKAVMRTG